MPVLAINKRASFDYELKESYEAGLVLTGQEVKSVKTGHMSLKNSFVTLKDNEIFLTGAMIPFYSYAKKDPSYSSSRPRKLLLHKKEIQQLIGKIRTQGLTLVPIQVYTKGSLLKLQFSIGKGKKHYDKRDSIKKKSSKRQIERKLKNSRL